MLAESERGQSSICGRSQFILVSVMESLQLLPEDIDWEKGTAHIQRNLNALECFVPPKTDAGDRVITLEPALEALKAQRTLTSLQPKTEIVFHHREYGAMEYQKPAVCFHARMRKGIQKAYYSYRVSAPDLTQRKTCWYSPNPVPYAAYFCLLAFILPALTRLHSQPDGHENAQMVYEVYGAWIEE